MLGRTDGSSLRPKPRAAAVDLILRDKGGSSVSPIDYSVWSQRACVYKRVVREERNKASEGMAGSCTRANSGALAMAARSPMTLAVHRTWTRCDWSPRHPPLLAPHSSTAAAAVERLGRCRRCRRVPLACLLCCTAPASCLPRRCTARHLLHRRLEQGQTTYPILSAHLPTVGPAKHRLSTLPTRPWAHQLWLDIVCFRAQFLPLFYAKLRKSVPTACLPIPTARHSLFLEPCPNTRLPDIPTRPHHSSATLTMTFLLPSRPLFCASHACGIPSTPCPSTL